MCTCQIAVFLHRHDIYQDFLGEGDVIHLYTPLVHVEKKSDYILYKKNDLFLVLLSTRC